MIWKVLLFGSSCWFTYFIVNLLYTAKTRGYVMARTESLNRACPETPQTRTANSKKFWANVIVGVALLPFAFGALYLSGSDLWTALQTQGH